MRTSRRGSRAAAGVTAVALLVGVGTVAAQSMGNPWWVETDLVDPADLTKSDGSVAILGAVFSGSLAKAKANFPTTGEYIGCSVTAVAINGQVVRCAARDSAGTAVECASVFIGDELVLREVAFLNAISSIDSQSYISVQFNQSNGECEAISVSHSSADFLANEGGGGENDGVSSCDTNNSTNLGAFGGAGATVNNAGCAVVSQFAMPYFSYGPNRSMQLQNPSGTTSYPLDYEYVQSCTGASGSGTFDQGWDDQYLPGLSDACPLFIKFFGDGAGNIKLSYF